MLATRLSVETVINIDRAVVGVIRTAPRLPVLYVEAIVQAAWVVAAAVEIADLRWLLAVDQYQLPIAGGNLFSRSAADPISCSSFK